MKRSGHSTPSGSNSITSNNITSQGDLQEDDEKLNNEDELVNIFVVIQNQVKLIFYNKSKDIDLNGKYTKNGNVKSKGNESSYFYSKLSDTTLSIWQDMGLYVMISSISIGYLIFSIIIIQTQINTFTPFIDYFDQTVSTSVYTTSLISKLSITTQRYLNMQSTSIPTQFTLLNFYYDQQISYFLLTISSDTSKIKSYISDMSKFLEQLNLDYGYDSNSSKIIVTSEQYQSRLPQIQQLSVLSEINHLLKDNLCYYTQDTLYQQQQQFDYFNTGLKGTLDILQKMQFNYQTFLSQYYQIQYQEQQINTLQVNAYYNTQEYKLLVMYGQELIYKIFDRLLLLLETFLKDEKESKNQLIQNLFIGIGIPIMV
ncbi:unnamed protein product (macronuclear) [Paramecium tetraurelia]|uniref:Transmembrane protein n=1 Tax=Paramecium tetraurelia TaxID=5888 RepID=A0CIL8_PARTE|nr:uncharacterized protein GSPATT00007770001 [Paramecium tetraurelia]CAK70635.1 unnamed protein product [Paramecium tetraurelia]|eukprot:XP_001438032.1 hypothetical protein (macronuclear) [Paramecium tetraurelia strain d4-2]